ncbi:hypothetical protein CLV58_12076 [Spirosoma oryzae]|uniref:Uncharacterized protein n=1 Tax=Spirosoma oryzae TaxID=1469603 RepID=A0A2T0SHC9_9BACT|nr:hypothetical protein CLV58_12076 [Spirosoma oryzae]
MGRFNAIGKTIEPGAPIQLAGNNQQYTAKATLIGCIQLTKTCVDGTVSILYIEFIGGLF